MLPMNKYPPFDNRPEAVAWRKANKKRVRSQQKRKPLIGKFTLLWVFAGVIALISPLLGLGLVALIVFLKRSEAP